MSRDIGFDINDIRRLLSMLVVIESYDAGLITREEAYKRSGIDSVLREKETVKVFDLNKKEPDEIEDD